MKHRNMRTAVRVGLLPAGIAVALAPAFAFAQESGKDATTLDKIEVTGSRIRSSDIETQQPVISLSRADIQRQGFTSVADIVQNISAAGSPAISRADSSFVASRFGWRLGGPQGVVCPEQVLEEVLVALGG